ncbi:DUF1844 domain-containing protein [Candidatus Deferrimicrobium sp.]|uniref:DUF1844 domain-containing protein n=1 Tax=Candidatus Deferrimicrobium sp. TaxID=3060586 RepID=UPI00271DDDEB|nr:DUF1844 domain-containing protein [Candidatus Deferrimicrobium sp.]MDO8739610.1 DUF1844 domain-containing protein [Candidatus Deferrimicrobium sp.]
MPEEKEDKGFKVIDRRGVEATPEPPSPPPSPPPKEKPPSAATEGKAPENAGVSPPKHPHEDSNVPGAKEGVPRFLDLVQSLQMGAMVGLGMLQGPDGQRPPIDLPAAKDSIDLLGILQEKTKGNLTKEEEEVLREGLYHLRMGYMAMINAPPAGHGKKGDQQ